jgi:hypothetical protein
MFAPGVVVFERDGRWESQLKRALGDERWVRGVRSRADAQRAAGLCPGGVLLLDLGIGDEALLQTAAEAFEQHWPVAVVAVGPPGLLEIEWPLREWGVVEVLLSNAGVDAVVSACVRRLDGVAVGSTKRGA